MSIYVGGEKAKLYRGDYCPAQLYKGDVKIAGYTNVEKVGTSISGVETYNDALLPTIEGKSAQTVTANSPSPDYPEPIRSSENFDVVSCGSSPATATTAHITDPLRSVGNVSDSIEVSEGRAEFIKRIAVRQLTGSPSERWSQYATSIGQKYACMFGQLLIGKQLGPILFTHDMQVSSEVISGTKLGVWANTNTLWPEHVYWGIEYSLIGTNPTSTAEENTVAFRAWLSAQATAGTPVTVQYQIETPTRTDITTTPLGQALLAMRTYPRYTQVYTNATLPPVIRAKIKKMVL